MPFTVSDFHDLLALLGQHPEWQAELRRQVLTDEVLSLPAVVRDLAAAQVRTEVRMDQFAERMDQLVARMDQLAERMDQLAERMDQLAAQLGSLATRVGTLDGEMLELRFARRAPAYLSRFARKLRVLDPSRVADLLDDAIDTGALLEAEREAALLTDVVLTGQRREDGADVYLVVEVSAGIRLGDVERARERAGLFAKLGRPAVPVVAGRSINTEAAEMARRAGVWQVLDGRGQA